MHPEHAIALAGVIITPYEHRGTLTHDAYD